MTIGIYALVFKGTDKVYIGRSDNIERRYRDHINHLSSGISPPKVQNAYNSYGTPELFILQECCIDQLNQLELEWIKEYNSVEQGWNSILQGDAALSGDQNINSIYTNEKIAQCLIFVYNNPSMSIKECSVMLDINYNTLFDVISGNGHTWLQEKYPIEYSIVLSRVGSRIKNNGKNAKNSYDRGLKNPILLSPEGVEYTIVSIRGFSKDNNLTYSCVHNLLKKKRTIYKGWTIKENTS